MQNQASRDARGSGISSAFANSSAAPTPTFAEIAANPTAHMPDQETQDAIIAAAWSDKTASDLALASVELPADKARLMTAASIVSVDESVRAVEQQLDKWETGLGKMDDAFNEMEEQFREVRVAVKVCDHEV
jgi:hypothetical protein